MTLYEIITFGSQKSIIEKVLILVTISYVLTQDKQSLSGAIQLLGNHKGILVLNRESPVL